MDPSEQVQRQEGRPRAPGEDAPDGGAPPSSPQERQSTVACLRRARVTASLNRERSNERMTASRSATTCRSAAILFALSVIGIFLNRKNLIVLLMAIELMLLAVNMNFVAFSHYLGDMAGQVFVFFILTVAAAESAIGLAILVVLFRNRATINVDELDALKG